MSTPPEDHNQAAQRRVVDRGRGKLFLQLAGIIAVAICLVIVITIVQSATGVPLAVFIVILALLPLVVPVSKFVSRIFRTNKKIG